ncbi:MAG: hypothetical protein OEO82_07035, partial [Gammaproteobacteria bacterium]|nr:hypothetical protein [Gammaproteobacteria bacterium]
MRKLASVALLLALLALVVFLLTPTALVNSATMPQLPDNLDRYLAARERAAGTEFPLIRDTEKRIR